jgi:hypothetical protein
VGRVAGDWLPGVGKSGEEPSAGVLVTFPGHALSQEDLQETLVGDIPGPRGSP